MGSRTWPNFPQSEKRTSEHWLLRPACVAVFDDLRGSIVHLEAFCRVFFTEHPTFGECRQFPEQPLDTNTGVSEKVITYCHILCQLLFL